MGAGWLAKFALAAGLAKTKILRAHDHGSKKWGLSIEPLKHQEGFFFELRFANAGFGC